jgi:hypothetical protein
MDRVSHNSLLGLLSASFYTSLAALYKEDGNRAEAQKYPKDGL